MSENNKYRKSGCAIKVESPKPIPNMHSDVITIDFADLYPIIMKKELKKVAQ